MYLLDNDLVNNDTEKYDLLCQVIEVTSDTDSKIKYCDQAIELAKNLDMLPALPYYLKGEAYTDFGKYELALECFIQAAHYFEENEDHRYLGRIYNSMAIIYSQQGNRDNEKLYLQNAIKVFEQENDSLGLSYTLHNLGYLNYSIGQYDSALVLLTKALDLFKKSNSPYEYFVIFGNIGLVHSRLSDFDNAEDYLHTAIDTLARYGDNYAIPEFIIEFANILQLKGEIRQAISYASRALNIAENPNYVRDASRLLAQLYEISGSFDSAYYYQSIFTVVNDSIKNIESVQKMADLRTGFEVGKKQEEVDVLEKIKLRNNIIIIGLGIILVLAIGLVTLYYVNLKRSRKLSRVLEERREQLATQSAELKEKNDEILSANEELQNTLENLRTTQKQLIQSEKMAALGGLVAGVAHEINTPVGISITAASSLAEETRVMAEKFKAKKISTAEFKDFLDTAYQSTRLILSNMEKAAGMVQSFKQVSVDQSTEEKRNFRLKEYFEDVLRSLNPKFKGRNIGFAMEMDEDLELDSYPGAYSQILTNLVMNSLVHGFDRKSKGNIKLEAWQKDGELKMVYRDDGKGIPWSDLGKIFDPFFTTDKQSSTGLGLHIVYNLVTQKLNGDISCISKANEGVEFKINIPYEV